MKLDIRRIGGHQISNLTHLHFLSYMYEQLKYKQLSSKEQICILYLQHFCIVRSFLIELSLPKGDKTVLKANSVGLITLKKELLRRQASYFVKPFIQIIDKLSKNEETSQFLFSIFQQKRNMLLTADVMPLTTSQIVLTRSIFFDKRSID